MHKNAQSVLLRLLATTHYLQLAVTVTVTATSFSLLASFMLLAIGCNIVIAYKSIPFNFLLEIACVACYNDKLK